MIKLNELLDIIKENYFLTPINTSAYHNLKVKGMKFDIKAFKVEGLGHVSIMRAKGLFGLMKMDALISNPLELDLPLYSYDRFLAMGNDTLIVEMYDTMIEKNTFESMDSLISKYNHLPKRDAGKHWYDDIKLLQSISFKGKKDISSEFDDLAIEHLKNFLDTTANNVTDSNTKKALSLRYVNGLLENGGPSTDVFTKGIGKVATEELYHKVLFGV